MATSPCALFEPALTNVGIVLPEPGYHEAVRESDATPRHAADQRRDPHDLRRSRRLHRRPRPAHPTCVTIGKTIGGGIPAGAYGVHARRVGDLIREHDDLGRRGRRRDRRDAGGQRAVDGGDAPRPYRGPHRRGVRADDPARRALGGRRGTRDRRRAGSLARHAPGRPRRVPLHADPAADGRRAVGERRRGAGAVPPPVGDEPRDPHDAVPQHGPDVARDDAADVDRHTAVFGDAVDALFA